jgi:hypothetical protein
MKNTIKEQRQKDILNLQNEIQEMTDTLKNSKNYLKYMKDCLKEIEEEEQRQIEKEFLIVWNVEKGHTKN